MADKTTIPQADRSPAGRLGAAIGFWNRLSVRLTLLLVAFALLLAVAVSFPVVAAFRAALADGVSEAVRSEASDGLRSALFIMAAFLLLALLSAAAFSRSLLIRPIEELLRGTEELARGRLGLNLPVRSASELGALASAFNGMSAQLAGNLQTLKESEARFRTLADTAPVMIWMSGEDQYADYFNRGWLEFTGRSIEMERGEGWFEGVHPDDRERCRQSYQAALQGQSSFEVEYRLRRKDGEYRWVLDRGIPRFVPGGAFAGFIGSCIDITERVEARGALSRLVEDRTRELTMLLNVSQSVTSTLELESLLDVILDELRNVVAYDAAAILIAEGRELNQAGYRGPAPRELMLGVRISVEEGDAFLERLGRGETMVIEDTRGDSPEARGYRRRLGAELLGNPGVGQMRAWMGVPLLAKDRAVGMIALQRKESGTFTPEQAALVKAVAAQAAGAIENARLFAQAQDRAALEERQRLARELHDSVSQALYGIALGARTARAQLKTSPAAALGPLDYVTGLAEAGLAEMRALIFELRPESLAQEGLSAALEKQAAALRARHGLDVELSSCDEPELPLAAKEALFRIAQEALHNVVKHAQAGRAGIALEQAEGRVRLTVTDDGVGFETRSAYPGHLGLRSMAERAAAQGGSLQVTSAAGEGSRVVAEMPAARAQSG